MWGNSLTVLFASDIFVWPAIHDIMYINPCLSQANGLVTTLLEFRQGGFQWFVYNRGVKCITKQYKTLNHPTL